MDLRIEKTRRAIKNAFLKLLAAKSLEQITVKELCQIAEISKGTFYLHYHDLFDLCDQLQREVIRNVLSSIGDLMDVVNNLDRFMRNLKEVLDSEIGSEANLLFSGVQRPLFPFLLVEVIKTMVFERHSDYRDDVEVNVLLSYHIYGGYYAFMENRNSFASDEVLKKIHDIHNAAKKNVSVQ